MTTSRALTYWLPVLLWAGMIFALLLVRALGREAPSLALGVLYAASDELHQSFVRGRHASPVDVAIDAVGLGLGLFAWRRVSRRATA